VSASDSAQVTVAASAPPPVVKTPQGLPIKPVIAKPATIPARLAAGKPAFVRFKVTRSDTGAGLTSGRMICDPSLNGKAIRHREQFRHGLATLRFTVPNGARGKTLKVRLTIKLANRSASRTASFHIR